MVLIRVWGRWSLSPFQPKPFCSWLCEKIFFQFSVLISFLWTKHIGLSGRCRTRKKCLTLLKQTCSLICWCQQPEILACLTRINWMKEKHYFCHKILIPDDNTLNRTQLTEAPQWPHSCIHISKFCSFFKLTTSIQWGCNLPCLVNFRIVVSFGRAQMSLQGNKQEEVLQRSNIEWKWAKRI